MSNSNNEDIKNMKYEQAQTELENCVRQLESGKLPLDELIVVYERAQQLSLRCETLLSQFEQRVTQVYKGADGTPQERPLQA